jgi:hypothetical protein
MNPNWVDVGSENLMLGLTWVAYCVKDNLVGKDSKYKIITR